MQHEESKCDENSFARLQIMFYKKSFNVQLSRYALKMLKNALDANSANNIETALDNVKVSGKILQKVRNCGT